jgi:hypothetical protein
MNWRGFAAAEVTLPFDTIALEKGSFSPNMVNIFISPRRPYLSEERASSYTIDDGR